MGVSGWNRNPGKDLPFISPFPREQESYPDRHQILLVEDNKADVFLLREAIELAHIPADLHVVTDGERAFAFIDEADAHDTAPCPGLVILDLNLPRKTGGEVLEHLRQSRKCRYARVLIVTSSDSEQDKASTAKLGADAYFRKPSGYDAYMKIGEMVKDMLGGETQR
jgi:chemotaxis family two-component system response regulator Rcp1